jgi:hypothetical protein
VIDKFTQESPNNCLQVRFSLFKPYLQKLRRFCTYNELQASIVSD